MHFVDIEGMQNSGRYNSKKKLFVSEINWTVVEGEFDRNR